MFATTLVLVFPDVVNVMLIEERPPSPVVVFGPAGTVPDDPVVVPMTCSMRSFWPTVRPEESVVVHPVREVDVVPVHLITVLALGVEVVVRSTNAPGVAELAINCSGEPATPVWLRGMFTGVPPVKGIGSGVVLVANASGSTPTSSVEGTPFKGSAEVGSRAWTSMPTPTLSPAGRWS